MKRLIEKNHLPIILAPIILFLPIISSGKALVWGTVSTQFVPWWDFAWESILKGQIPLWNPWVGMGAPLVANYQSGIFYPPYWILLLIYALAGLKWMSWSITLVVVLHLIWSGLGVARLLEELGLGKLAQTIGGMAFSLSGYLIARAGFLSINSAAAWLPWILIFSLRIVRKKKFAFWTLVLVMAFQLLAGHAQTTWYSLLLGGIWIFYHSLFYSNAAKNVRKLFQDISKYILAGLLGAGISAIQLIPTVEYLLQSQRSVEYGYAEAMTYSFWPWRFLTLLVPNLFGNPAAGNYWGYGNYWEDAVYIGLLPVLIAMGTAIRFIVGKKTHQATPEKRKLVIFLSGIVLVSFLLALGDNAFLFRFLYRYVPTFDLFQAPTRFSLWAELALVILAAIGVDQLTRPTGKRKYWIRLTAAGCIALIGGAYLGWKFLVDVRNTFFIPFIMAGILGLGTALLILFKPDNQGENDRNIWSGLVVLLVAVDLLVAGWGLNPGVEIDFYDVNKNGEKGARTFMPADLEYDLKFRKYFRFDTFSPEVPWAGMSQDFLPNLPILQRIEMVNNFDPLVPARFQEWINEYNKLDDRYHHQMSGLMNIKKVISETDGLIRRMEIERVTGHSEVQVNDLVEISRNDQGVLDQIIGQDLDLSTSVILASSSTVGGADCQNKGNGEVSIIDRGPGYIKIKADLDNNSWLVWSESWYPGWVAVLDGRNRIEVERANYIFQAVCVPKGNHIVEIVYRPGSFYLGAGITSACLISLIAVMVINKKRNSI